MRAHKSAHAQSQTLKITHHILNIEQLLVTYGDTDHFWNRTGNVIKYTFDNDHWCVQSEKKKYLLEQWCAVLPEYGPPVYLLHRFGLCVVA